jgi:IclR family acetate operon transcriptional repressor
MRAAMAESGHVRLSMSSVKRSLGILELIVGLDQAPTHADLARRLKIAKSTLSQLLAALRDSGYVALVDNRYHPGMQLISLGHRIANKGQAMSSVKPSLDALARESGETVLLGVRVREQVIYIDQSPSPNPIRYVTTIGEQRPLHATAIGRCFMAYGGIPPETLAERGRVTPRTVTDIAALARLIEAVRKNGFAFNEGESVEGVSALAMPILDAARQPMAAVTVVGPSHRMKDAQKRILPLLRLTIDQISVQKRLG